ncbi:MAG: AraC family transcriptional regulator [Clostridiales bacterium]|nr:AraC family transcriptional regulator [Clostridiales bacterium]
MEIIKAYTQEIPATRFIGKKYTDADRVGGSFGAKWGEAFETGLFGIIEAASGNTDKNEFFTDSGAYVGLMSASNNESFEYWIGMFTPVGTTVPDGFQYIDLPASKLGIGWVYGDESEIYCNEQKVADKLGEQGVEIWYDDKGACWFFERYQCPRYTTPDDKGKVILDVGFFAK